MPIEDAFSNTLSANVMVPVRDGVRLATDIYRPALPDGTAHPGPLPAILVRTSYDKSSPTIVVEPIAKFFIRHGYAVISQDLRGRGTSEGTGQYFHMANVNEGADGYDTIEWIAAQPWCNGRVGMTGPSHLGVVQNVAALHRPPHLKAIWADVAPTKVIDGTSREGGAMAMHMFGAMFLHGFDAQEIRNDLGARRAIEQSVENLGDQVMQMPFRRGATALAAIPAIEQTLFRYYWNGIYDEWWSMEPMDLHPHIHRFADVYPRSESWPEGFHMNLADTILRGRFRNGLEREEMMEPKRVYRFTLTLPPIANRFLAGHRIRLDVASSNFPRFDVNPGTGEKLGRHTATRRAHNTLHASATLASHLVIPVANGTVC
jgi:predicted acyl esterase